MYRAVPLLPFSNTKIINLNPYLEFLKMRKKNLLRKSQGFYSSARHGLFLDQSYHIMHCCCNLTHCGQLTIIFNLAQEKKRINSKGFQKQSKMRNFKGFRNRHKQQSQIYSFYLKFRILLSFLEYIYAFVNIHCTNPKMTGKLYF